METIKKYLPGMKPSRLSLNEYIVDDIGADTGISSFAGRKGVEIYSFGVLAEMVRQSFAGYEDGQSGGAVRFLQQKISGTEAEARKVRRILDQMAAGLAALFYSLYKGSESSRFANELTDEDWDFWSCCSHIFLVGGLAEGKLGQYLQERLQKYSDRLGMGEGWIQCFCVPGVKTLSLLGCAKADFVRENTVYVFDFGNTAIKCGRAVCNDGTWRLEERPVILHQGLVADNTVETAKQIHEEIAGSIRQTIEYYGNTRDSYCVSLCMANNIIHNELMDRGRYRSLRLLADSYPDYLRAKLERIIKKPFTVYMMNDAQAVACLFREWAPQAAVVTLGTRMGIAYPEEKK